LLARAALALLVLVGAAACGDDDGGDEAPPDPLRTAVGQGAPGSFTHGVASGDVTSTTAALWTRADGASSILAEVSPDEEFEREVKSISTTTSAARDFVVQATASELTPDTQYYYRFSAGGSTSETGRFRTAPRDIDTRRVRFVFSGDSDGSRDDDGEPRWGEFDVLDRAASEEDAAFFLYLGDTIYADRDPAARSLDAFRAKYKANREYEALARIMREMPVFAIWDDHEVTDNFSGQTVDRVLFDAGLTAFREYMPISGASPSRLFRAGSWGTQVELILLDERSYRDESAAAICTAGGQPDPIPGAAAPGAPDNVRGLRSTAELPAEPPAGCLATLDDPARTMLGPQQKEYLKTRLLNSPATWKLIASSTPVQSLLALPYDRWEGFAAERRELLQFIRDNGIRNVVFLSADFHGNVFGEVRVDPFADDGSVAYEAVVGPIATATLRQDIIDVVGEAGASGLEGLLTGVVGVECAKLDSYAYGLVDVDPESATLTVTAKDADGNELCTKELRAQ
jgi:alkaline phosphatase D